MRVLCVLCSSFFFTFLFSEESFPDRDTIQTIYTFAAEGHPEGQVLMGLLCELGLGMEKNDRNAALWYAMAAHGGNRLAFRRWGMLTFFGFGVPKNERTGFLMMCLGPDEDIFPDMTEDDWNLVREIRSMWDAFDFPYRPLAFTPVSFVTQTNSRKQPKALIQLASDRPDPMDANERIYGPGTGDWNTGILRSEQEQMQRDYRELLKGIEAFRISTDERKAQDLRAQIERLSREVTDQKHQAFKECIIAVGTAMAAGLSIPYPLVALIEAYGAVEGFKSAADHYVHSVHAEKEASRLLEMERSLERARSFGRRE